MNATIYLQKAASNEEFLGNLLQSKTQHHDWIVTVRFYIAVHYINAFLSEKTSGNFCTHNTVKHYIAPTGVYQATRLPDRIAADYFALQNLSRKARYLRSHENDAPVLQLREKHAAKASKLLDSVRDHMVSVIDACQPVTSPG